jgi:glutamate synthase (NADPH/NADH) large chain
MQTAQSSQGLYDGRDEHDACGVAFVATLSGTATHEIVDQALTALRNLDHRGASGAEPDSGDGAGILTQIPDTLLRETTTFTMPPRPRPGLPSSASLPRRALRSLAGAMCRWSPACSVPPPGG